MVDRLRFVVEPMTLADLDRVMEIERVAFSAPWSARAYRYEITQNEHSVMRVARLAASPGLPPPFRSGGFWQRLLRRTGLSRPGSLVGYAGAWILVDEIHVATIAVDPEWRGRGLGELLLLSLLEIGLRNHARRATLEVRVSNVAAQELYHKLGFEVVSRRRRYYADNDEDAYIMATPAFDAPPFRSLLKTRRDALRARPPPPAPPPS